MNLESTCAIFNFYLQLAVFNLITSVSQLFQQMLFYKNNYTLYFFPGLFFKIFSYFGSFMVVWGLGFWGWGLILGFWGWGF